MLRLLIQITFNILFLLMVSQLTTFADVVHAVPFEPKNCTINFFACCYLKKIMNSSLEIYPLDFDHSNYLKTQPIHKTPQQWIWNVNWVFCYVYSMWNILYIHNAYMQRLLLCFRIYAHWRYGTKNSARKSLILMLIFRLAAWEVNWNLCTPTSISKTLAKEPPYLIFG